MAPTAGIKISQQSPERKQLSLVIADDAKRARIILEDCWRGKWPNSREAEWIEVLRRAEMGEVQERPCRFLLSHIV